MPKDELPAPARARPGYWFAPKAFGYGATPVTWQGWALTLGYVALIVALARMVRPALLAGALGVVTTVALIVVIRAKTDGDWHWRWGSRR